MKGDLGVRDGRIVAVGGTISEDAAETLDADGLVVSPGFVDVHTHYDAQLFWDPYATPSNVHGVTTVLGGNCGFTLAPLHAKDADYLRRMMAKVEGMPLVALETGLDWKWESFGEYLNLLDGKIGLNAGFLVGHCALRRYVMGEDAIGSKATPEQIDEMVRVLHASIEAGALGFSTTLSSTHSDGDGKPVASRWASKEELLALCKAVGEHEGTLLEGIVQGCLDKFSDDEIELLADMSAAAGRPLNWNVLTIDGRTPEKVEHQLKASARAREKGGRVVALTMPTLVPMNMSLRTFCALNLIPGWGDVLGLPIPERIAALKDRTTRDEMLRKANSPEAGVFRRLADFGRYVIGDTFSAENEGLKGRKVADIAEERGDTDPFETLVNIAAADELKHRAVADADRQRPGLLGASRRHLEQPGRRARRLRRRRPPRPDGRRALPHPLSRRLHPRAQAAPARARDPDDDRRAGPTLRTARARPAGRGLLGRHHRLRPRDGHVRRRHPGARPSRRLRPAHRRLARAWCAYWSTAPRSCVTARRQARCPAP